MEKKSLKIISIGLAVLLLLSIIMQRSVMQIVLGNPWEQVMGPTRSCKLLIQKRWEGKGGSSIVLLYGT